MAYNPSLETTSSKPIGVNGKPVDGRTYYHDTVNFTWRPFVNRAEVLTYLPTLANRQGHAVIVINTGGTLVSGVVTGGTNELWYFKDAYTDNDLVPLLREVKKFPFTVGDSGSLPVDGGSSFTNSTFVAREILSFSIGGISIPDRGSTNLYYTHNANTGLISLINGVFTTGDYVNILYK